MRMIGKNMGGNLARVLAMGFLAMACYACAEIPQDNNNPNTENPMLFGVQTIADTKIAYGTEDFKNEYGQTVKKITAKFEVGEEIGVYSFYNNFYYHYPQYDSYAESVIFTNFGMSVTDDEKIIVNGDGTSTTYKNLLSYSPLKSWTFSTIYGTAPHTLDVVAYAPFEADYNENYVYMGHTLADDEGENGGAATLYFSYYHEETGTLNSDKDFMTAYTRYDKDDSGTKFTSETFRNYMLGVQVIPMTFKRQTAVLNLKVTKPKNYPYDITVNSMKVHFDAPAKFAFNIHNNTTSWSELTKGLEVEIPTESIDKPKLIATPWDGVPDITAVYNVNDLLKIDKMPHFPPGTNIRKIVFNITASNPDIESVTEKTPEIPDIELDTPIEYTWHPHIDEIKANTLVTLTLELDPKRKN